LFATVPFAAIQIFGSGLLTLTNRQHATMLTLGSIAACEVLLDLALIPFAGAMGAAIAVAVSQVAGAAATVFLIRRWLLPDDQVYKALGRIGLALSAAVPTGIGCLAVAGPPVAAAAAICVYVAGLAVLRIGILPPKAA
jgi:O-antigen/teichoic acid export membrane protein